MLKCNRCGQFDAEDGSSEVVMITLAEHKSPLTGKYKQYGWETFTNVAYVSCEQCALKLSEFMDSFYFGEEP
jgi:hypothetical protein